MTLFLFTQLYGLNPLDLVSKSIFKLKISFFYEKIAIQTDNSTNLKTFYRAKKPLSKELLYCEFQLLSVTIYKAKKPLTQRARS
ncbi:hypothetical protein C0966_13390 [Bacillus methanolicus]|nr:hypothetical protein [Bacillus methanolicus]